MKSILDLTRAITDKKYYSDQFLEIGEDKNILFVNPELSGKQLYKSILPYLSMYNENVCTAITGVAKFNSEQHLINIGEVELTSKEILWADYIVFPFTVQNLWRSKDGLESIYSTIRRLNAATKIVFTVDFNFYELSKAHPYRYIFEEKTNFFNVLNNIWASDIVMVSNLEFHKYLLDKLNNEAKTTFRNVPTGTHLVCLPFIFDVDIMLENVDYDPAEPTNIINREIVKKIVEVSEEVKKADLENKSKKAASNGKQTKSKTRKLILKKAGETTTAKPIIKKLEPKSNSGSGDNKRADTGTTKPIIRKGAGTKPATKSKGVKSRGNLRKNK